MIWRLYPYEKRRNGPPYATTSAAAGVVQRASTLAREALKDSQETRRRTPRSGVWAVARLTRAEFPGPPAKMNGASTNTL